MGPPPSFVVPGAGYRVPGAGYQVPDLGRGLILLSAVGCELSAVSAICPHSSPTALLSPVPVAQHRIWSVMVITSIGWGTSGVLTRAAFAEGMEPFTVVSISSAIAAAAVVAYSM